MEVEEYTTRVARLLSQAMNTLALIESAQLGNVVDGLLLHQTLGALIPELTWLDTHRGGYSLEGLAWPADMADCVARLTSELQAWQPSAPVPSSVLTSGAACLRFVRT